MVEFYVGVDGGGSGTRALLARPDGSVISRGEAGPSALGQGIDAAWEQVGLAISAAFLQSGLAQPDWSRIALAAGLSGVHTESLRDAFRAKLPPLGKLLLETDGYTMLIGAHAGQPGVVVAAGTGSVGEVLRKDRSHAVAGGWGFPVGDEGSGSWLGLRAMQIAQAALDGRAPTGALAHRVWDRCGKHRQNLAVWCASAGQFAYAQLAPLVFDCADRDPAAFKLLERAAQELESLADTLDPSRTLPVAICGSIGVRLQSKMTPHLCARTVEASMNPAEGALWLLAHTVGDSL